MLFVTGLLFERGLLTATSQTILWSVIFFVASSAASSAYLTVSEVFPLEIRAMAIAVFYAVGTGVGGLAAPALFGALIETRSALGGVRRLRLRRGAHARRRGGGLVPRRQRRAALARGARARDALTASAASQASHASSETSAPARRPGVR